MDDGSWKMEDGSWELGDFLRVYERNQIQMQKSITKKIPIF